MSVIDPLENDTLRTRALEGATAVVTGASGGIGRAIAIALGHHGVQVVITGRRAGQLEETAEGIVRAGGRAIVHVLDLTQDEALYRLADRVEEVSAGQLALLIHCAARHMTGSVQNTSVETFDSALDSNLRAPIVLTRRLLPLLLHAKGDIVFVNSLAIFNARADYSAYTVSKAGLKTFADCLRTEMNPLGVRVLTVIPGRSATPMQAELSKEEGRTYRPELLLQPEDVASTTLHALLLPRTAELIELHIRPANKL